MPIVRAQADIDSNGKLDTDELKLTLKKPQFVNTAMENLDINMDGSVSLREWLIAQKATFDKSEAACKTSLKAMEKGACRRLHCALRHALTARVRLCLQPSLPTRRRRTRRQQRRRRLQRHPHRRS